MAETAAYAVRGFSGSAALTSLASSINSSDTTITVTSGASYAGLTNFRITINEGENTEEEIEVGSVSGNTFQSCVRGVGGTSASSHTSGELIRHTSSKRDFEEANKAVNETVGQITAANQLLVSDGANSLAALDVAASRLVGRAAAGNVDDLTVAQVKTLLAYTIPDLSFVGAKGNRATTAQSIPNNTWTSVQMNAETIDSDGFHDNSTNPSRFTVPAGKAGKYHIIGRAEFVANATGRRIWAIALNGTRVAFVEFPTASGTIASIGEVSTLLNLAVADYVELQVFQSSGGALDVSLGAGTTDLSLHLVGA